MLQEAAPELTFRFDDMDPDTRIRELILYISDKCSDDPGYGATKLNKILYHSDFIAFLRDGRPVTGAEYSALEHGPAPRRLVPVRDSLIAEGNLVIKLHPILDKVQHRPIALRPPRLDLFSARDISIVDEVIQELWGKTAAEVSDGSHGIAWVATDEGESVPYEAAYLSDEPLSQAEIARAQELARTYAWDV
jgi:hypothetical protein